jgi:hypothetical protein
MVKREARAQATERRDRPPQRVALPGFQSAPESREGLRAMVLENSANLVHSFDF